MKICMVLPEWSKRMRWFRVYVNLFSQNGYDIVATNNPLGEGVPPCDVYAYMWADNVLIETLDKLPKHAKVVVFLRRYEFYQWNMSRIDWNRVNKLICVNPYFASILKKGLGVQSEVIPNGVDLSKWTYKERGHGKNIAVVGFVNSRKNIPLALQILNSLPEDYTLHFAGEVQERVLEDYMDYVAKRMKRKIHLHGHIDNLDVWLDQMNYLLCASVTEGNPNNVLEAMAKGIKPLIHTWPGAVEQFPEEWTFDDIDAAVFMTTSASAYNSAKYREFIEKRHSETPYKRVLEIVNELCGKAVPS